LTKSNSLSIITVYLGESTVSTQISALEHRPHDFIREVSPAAIDFYVEELSGLYLPDDFRQAHGDVHSVERWKPEDRLCGKFGRFALRHAQEEDGQGELDDILLIGTTIGLSGVDRYRRMKSLRHYELEDNARDMLKDRNLTGPPIEIIGVDYGGTSIKFDDNGLPQSIRVEGLSYDFGRAEAEGRQETCKLFERLVGNSVQVINVDPEPKEYEQIIE
jgi:hypothetical protein